MPGVNSSGPRSPTIYDLLGLVTPPFAKKPPIPGIARKKEVAAKSISCL